MLWILVLGLSQVCVSDIVDHLSTNGVPPGVLLETLDKATLNTRFSWGRRRTVQDTDCDLAQAYIDEIEGTCARYRYTAFENIYQGMMNAAYNDTSMLDRTSKLNDTFAGGLSNLFAGGIRVFFDDQRQAIYGPNGTCLAPKPGGLSLTVDSLSAALFSVMRKVNGVMDTMWTNSKIIDGHMNRDLIEEGQQFANITSTVMELMNKFQASVYVLVNRENQRMVNTVNTDLLSNVSRAVNQMAELLDIVITDTDKNYTDFHTNVDPQVNAILDKLDSLSDRFINGDSEFANVIQNVANQMNPKLTAVPGKEASVPIGSIRSSSQKLIGDFKSSSDNSVKGASDDWQKSMDGLAQSALMDSLRHQEYIDSGNSKIDNSFNESSSVMDDSFATSIGSSKSRISDVKQTAQAMRDTVWKMSSQLHNVQGSLQTMFESLSGTSGDAAADLRARLGALLGSTGTASSDQLKVLLTDFLKLQKSLGNSGNEVNMKLFAAVTNVRDMVGRGGTSGAQTSSDIQSTLNSESDYSRQVANSHASSQSAIVSDTSKTLVRNADGTVNEIYAASDEYATQSRTATREVSGALMDASSTVSDSMTTNELVSSGTKVGIVNSIFNNATSIDQTSAAAGADLYKAHDSLSGSLTAASSLNQLFANTDNQGSDAIGSMETQLGNDQDAIANQFSQSTRTAFAGLSGKAESAQQRSNAVLTQQASGFSNQIGSTVVGLDQGTASVQAGIRQALGGAQDAGSDLGVVEESLDDLIRDVFGKGQSVVTDAEGSLNAALMGALSSAQSVGTKLGASNSDSESQFDIESGKAVNSVLSGFRDRSKSVLTQAAGYSDDSGRVAPDLHASGLSLEQAYALALKTMDQASSQNQEIGNFEFPDVFEARKMVNDQLSTLGLNLTSLSAAAGRIVFNSTTGVILPESYDSSIRAIVDEVLRNSDFINKAGLGSVEALEAVSESSSGDSLGILNDLNSADQAWKDGYTTAIESGLVASRTRVGSIGDLADESDGISTLLSQVQGNQAALSKNSLKLSDLSEQQISRMMTDLMGSVRTANSSLTRASASAGAQAQFGSNVNNGMAGKLLQALNQEAALAESASASSGSALSDSSGRFAMDISRMETTIAQDQQVRDARISQVLSNVSSADADFTKDLAGNKDATAIQLLMAKRAVRDILNSWTRYTEYEMSKFEKMGQTDEGYIQMTQRNLDSSESSSRDKLLSSKVGMETLNGNLQSAMSDYLSFTNSSQSQLNLLGQVAPMLKDTTRSSIKQLSETAANFMKQDSKLDVEARNETLTAIQDFEASLDHHAMMATAAASGNLLPALAAR